VQFYPILDQSPHKDFTTLQEDNRGTIHPVGNCFAHLMFVISVLANFHQFGWFQVDLVI